MGQRRGLAEDTYEPVEEQEGWWSKVRRGLFGSDEGAGDDDAEEQEVHTSRRHHTGPTLFPLSGSSRQIRVSVRLNATSMEDAQDAVDSLKERNQVILNLEHADEGMDRRILDFVSGACYALDGCYQRVGSKVFLFAPSNIFIEVEGESAASASSARPPSFLSQ